MLTPMPPDPLTGAGATPLLRSGLLATVVLLLAMAVVLSSACDARASVSAPRTTTATPTATPAGLPAFTDWRVVYAGYDGRIHAISTDGKQVVDGSMLFGLAHSSLNFPSVSPNGHWLAYGCTSGVCILDLTGHHALLTFADLPRNLAWSTDSSMLAVDGGL